MIFHFDLELVRSSLRASNVDSVFFSLIFWNEDVQSCPFVSINHCVRYMRVCLCCCMLSRFALKIDWRASIAKDGSIWHMFDPIFLFTNALAHVLPAVEKNLCTRRGSLRGFLYSLFIFIHSCSLDRHE